MPSGDFGRCLPSYQVSFKPGGTGRLVPGRVLPPHLEVIGIRLGTHRQRSLGLDRGGILQLQRPERQVDHVAPHVAQGPVAEIPPVLPRHGSLREVAGVIGPHRRRPDPQVPVQPLRHRGRLLRPARRTFDPLVHPNVGFPHRPDRPRSDQLDHAAVVVGGVDLRAHLGRHLHLLGRFPHHAGLVDRVGQRLLAIDVLAPLHGRDAGQGVGVLGGADGHRVDVLLVEHLAPVGVGLGLGMPLGGLGQVVVIHVAQGDDVLAGRGHGRMLACPRLCTPMMPTFSFSLGDRLGAVAHVPATQNPAPARVERLRNSRRLSCRAIVNSLD